jgi:hypothetical protein
VTDAADRSVRLLASGSRGGFATARPGSLAVTAVLFVLAGILVLAGLEATDSGAPVVLDPAQVERTHDLGNRTYATMHGSISAVYVETFEDANANGTEDRGENGIAWYYWLVDPVARTGVTVRSTRPPAAIYTYQGDGVLIGDPGYLTEDYPRFALEAEQAGLHIDATRFVDATSTVAGKPTPLDLAAPLPPTGTSVSISGSWLGSYILACTADPDRNRKCDPDEQDVVEILVFEPGSKHAVGVFLRDPPEFSDATLTGLLRREERSVDDAKTTEGLRFGDLDLAVSDRYILDDGAGPGSATLAFALAGLLASLAGIILIGLAGGYLVYRRSDGALPAPFTSLAPGERVPLRITGIVRTPTGLEHVREAPAELVRFALERPRPPATVADPPEAPESDATHATSEPTDPSSAPPIGAEATEPPLELPELTESTELEAIDASLTPTTLLVERVGHPHGVALGRGELERLSAGEVMPLAGPRPAVRAVAGTGPLFLSFDTEAERDRVAAELLDESGLGPDGRRIATPDQYSGGEP